MKIVFADSFYFFALLNPHEAPHAKAVAFAGIFEGTLVTTGWVLTEVADGMARPGNRELFLAIHHELQKRSGIRIVACCEELYQGKQRGKQRWQDPFQGRKTSWEKGPDTNGIYLSDKVFSPFMLRHKVAS